MMSNELLPCPFCGGEAEAVHEINGFWTVECIKCGALVDGIAAWNSRAELTCENKAPRYLDFLCSECGFVHYIDDNNCTGDGNEWNYCPNCGAKVVSE